MDLEREIGDGGEGKVDMTALEQDFIKAAAEYGRRKGITYAAWREVGVAPSVLKAARISRAS